MSAMMSTPMAPTVTMCPAMVMAVPVVSRAAVIVGESQAERHGRIGIDRAAVGIAAVIGVGWIAGITISRSVGSVVGRVRWRIHTAC